MGGLRGGKQKPKYLNKYNSNSISLILKNLIYLLSEGHQVESKGQNLYIMYLTLKVRAGQGKKINLNPHF